MSKLKHSGSTSSSNDGSAFLGVLIAIAAVVAGHFEAVPRGAVAAGLVVSTILLARDVRASWTTAALHIRAYAGRPGLTSRHAKAVQTTALTVISAWLAAMEALGIRPALEGMPHTWIFWWMSDDLPRPAVWSSGLFISLPLGWGISALVCGSWTWALLATASFAAGMILLNKPDGWLLCMWPPFIMTMVGLHYSCPACGRMLGLKESSKTLVDQRTYTYTTEEETEESRAKQVLRRGPHDTHATYRTEYVRTPVRIIRERTGIISTFLHRFRCRRCGFRTERMSSSNS